MAWPVRAQGTRHSATCARVFSRYDLTCPRCAELATGAQARPGWHSRKADDRAAVMAIRSHNCVASRCFGSDRGPEHTVCTFGEW
jgi:hypothetical protein